MMAACLGSGSSGSVAMVEQLETHFKDGVTSLKTKMRAVKVGRFGDYELLALQAGIKNIPRYISEAETDAGTAVTMQFAKIGDIKKSDLLKVAEGVSRAIIDLNRKLKSDGKLKDGERIIHHDIKPANIGVTRGGKIKLLDWGSAKVVSKDIKTNPLAGATALYSPPEACSGSTPTEKNDSWALGATIFKYATGRHLLKRENLGSFILSLGAIQSEEILKSFKSASIYEILESVRESALEEFNENKRQFIADPEIDTTTKSLVLKLLEINPEERLSLDEALEMIDKSKALAPSIGNVTAASKVTPMYTIFPPFASWTSAAAETTAVEEELEHSIASSGSSYSEEIFEVETADDCLVAEITTS
jgi:serine/threonine protein kinase